VNPDYKGRSFDEVEPQLQSAYGSAGQSGWGDVRAHAQRAYERGREVGEQRLTLAEEELRIGKRRVQAGEVALHKTVDVERVQQTIALMHEEVTIERRAVTDPNASFEVQITDDEIRIPIISEEVVIEKRVVGKEEVVVRTRQVTENQTVEADLRRERLEIDRNVDTVRGGTGATGGAGGLGDATPNSAQNLAANVKDRLDGNPRT
jgi:uncharacterized protein (TIGR02271 family)